MISFRLSTEADAVEVGENLREQDRLEIERSTQLPAHAGPLRGLRASLICWTMVRRGRPIALFGVAPSKTPGVGIVWLLGTPEMSRAAKSLVGAGRYYVDLMGRLFPRGLTNAIDSENDATRRWLRALGFVEGETHIGPTGHPFILIHYVRPTHV